MIRANGTFARLLQAFAAADARTQEAAVQKVPKMNVLHQAAISAADL